MDQELTKDIGLQINSYYETFVATLLDPSNYINKPKIDNVKIYLSFVDASLEKPCGRIVHLHAFLDLTGPLMTDRRYPFCFLMDSAKGKIKSLYCQTRWLMDGLENYDTQAAEALERDSHEG